MTDGPHYIIVRNEDDAFRVFRDLRDTYGWAGTVMCRDDVEDALGRPLTDAEWELVRTSGIWRHITDGFASYGNDVITDLFDVLQLNNTTED